MEFSNSDQFWPCLSCFCVLPTEEAAAKTSLLHHLEINVNLLICFSQYCDVLEDGISLVFLEEQNARHILDAQ